MSSSTPVAEAAEIKLPPGWTDDEGYFGKSYYWAEKDSIKTMLKDEYDIQNAEPVLTRTRDSGDVIFLLESTNVEDPARKTYYVWNGIASTVCKIEGDMGLTDIYEVMGNNRGYLGRLPLTEVPPLGARDE